MYNQKNHTTMERYNYEEQVKIDIVNAINENQTKELAQFKSGELSKEDFSEMLYEYLFVSDSVTGNASGSYFCNAWKAEECVCHNLELLGEAVEVFGSDMDILKDGAEACDVTIRCYLLSGCINDLLECWEDED